MFCSCDALPIQLYAVLCYMITYSLICPLTPMFVGLQGASQHSPSTKCPTKRQNRVRAGTPPKQNKMLLSIVSRFAMSGRLRIDSPVLDATIISGVWFLSCLLFFSWVICIGCWSLSFIFTLLLLRGVSHIDYLLTACAHAMAWGTAESPDSPAHGEGHGPGTGPWHWHRQSIGNQYNSSR